MLRRHPLRSICFPARSCLVKEAAARSLALPLLVFALTACGGAQADETLGTVNIRVPHATFTPTPPDAGNNEPGVAPQVDSAAASSQTADAVSADTGAPAAENAEAASAPGEEPKAIINGVLVNTRTGPGTEYTIVAEVERGEEFTIVGRDEIASWWKVCCVNEQEVWVIDTFVDTIGAVDAVQPVANVPAPVAAAPAVPAQNVNPAPAAPAPTPAPPPAEPAPVEPAPEATFPFNLELNEQFPENKVVRVFLYVYDSSGGLAGYSVRVAKNGTELPVSETSFGPQPGFTWPINDDRQRFQNMKVEFPGQSPAGTWEVQLVDGGGTLVGPPATFNLAANEPNQELYVRYVKK